MGLERRAMAEREKQGKSDMGPIRSNESYMILYVFLSCFLASRVGLVWKIYQKRVGRVKGPKAHVLNYITNPCDLGDIPSGWMGPTCRAWDIT